MTPATREILQEGIQRGIEQGIEQGIQRGSRMQAEKLVLQMLEKKFGYLAEDERTIVRNLSVEKIEVLILDSLDFSERKDFEEWLKI